MNNELKLYLFILFTTTILMLSNACDHCNVDSWRLCDWLAGGQRHHVIMIPAPIGWAPAAMALARPRCTDADECNF